MARETGVQSQIDSYQRLKEWYLMPPCITHRIIKYESSVSGAIQEKEGNSPKVAIEKGAFG